MTAPPSSPVEVHELNAHFLEGSLREQVPLDAGEGFMRVVIRLLDQTSKIWSYTVYQQ